MGLLSHLRQLISPAAPPQAQSPGAGTATPISARVAVYDDPAVSPRVITLDSSQPAEFIAALSARVYEIAAQKGGSLPYSVIRELIENLIHASFRDVTVSISPTGNTIRISDLGPGISDKQAAMKPGFSTADSEMKKLIKGVGSGLPVAKEAMSRLGGCLEIHDNLGAGTVVTLYLPSETDREHEMDPFLQQIHENSSFHAGNDSCQPEYSPRSSHNDRQNTSSPQSHAATAAQPHIGSRPDVPRHIDLPEEITRRQFRVLLLIDRLGKVGPSAIADNTEISLSTAYRDLVSLENNGYLAADDEGKRSLTAKGRQLIQTVNHTGVHYRGD